jgi:probable rRNA maturation factor
MDDPSPTDVITFPPAPDMQSAGEIIVSVDHARTRAVELHLPLARELALYLAHGWLHLVGFDDRNNTDRQKMRQAENTILNALDQLPQFPHFQIEES